MLILFSIVANSSEARKCYDMGLYAESAQFCAMVQDDNRLCIEALRQAMDSQNPEVSIRSEQSLTSKSQAASGESSMEGSKLHLKCSPEFLLRH